jgi:acyl carrier protein
MQLSLSNLEEGVLAMIAGHLIDSGRKLCAESDLFAEGLDSMGIMQLMILIEQRYGVVIPAGEVTRENFSTARGMASLIRRLAMTGS